MRPSMLEQRGMGGARGLEERAARWLIRREEPEWTLTDQAALDAWLSDSSAHKATYWRLEHGWRQADRIASLGVRATAQRYALPKGWRFLALAVALLVGLMAPTF